MKINCLSYALRFWNDSPHYRIWYNSDHAINLPLGSSATGFLPVEDFGLEYFKSAFNGLLSDSDLGLLNKYFENEAAKDKMKRIKPTYDDLTDMLQSCIWLLNRLDVPSSLVEDYGNILMNSEATLSRAKH